MSPSATDYQYDVFFSYKRHRLTQDWMRKVQSRLKFWISHELGGEELRMFIDEEGIETGERWPERLRHALRHSRCLVCVWSPPYFQSGWCESEWRSFMERERLLNVRLIAPFKLHDGEHFPDEAKDFQWTDIETYTSTFPGFRSTQRAVEFEDRLKEFSRDVAGIVRSAPSFQPDWPIVESFGHKRAKIGLAKL